MRRRALLGVLALGGCGFHPTYGGGDAGPASTALAGILVDLLPERNGQLLRLALQRRFEGSGRGVPKTSELSGVFAIGTEGTGIQPDSSSTRTRFFATASYRLVALTPDRRTITSGAARAIDGLDVVNSQYFAADLESGAIQRRLAEAIADRITGQLSAFFARAAAAG